MIRKIRLKLLNYNTIIKSKLIELKYKYIIVSDCFNLVPRKRKIIVSLTTYPKRIDSVYIVIKSLMRQEIKPDYIILYLGNDCNDSMINSKLRKLEKKGLKIIFTDDNLKSHKKYFYAMHDFPDDLIITADDDLIYDKYFIEKLYENYNKHPNDISALRVHQLKFDDNNGVMPYRNWEFECNTIFQPSSKLFLTSGAGALFPPHVLPHESFDKINIKKLSINADDIWINLMLLINNKKIIWVPSNKQMPVMIYSSQKDSLFATNLDDGGNDECIHMIIEFYKLNLYDLINKGSGEQ